VCAALADSYTFTKIVDSGSGYYLQQTIGGHPQINNSGTVVFTAHGQLPTGNFAILTGNGGPLTLIAGDSYSPSHNSLVSSWGASINDAGVVAYHRTDQYEVNATSGIYTSAGTTIYESATSVSNDPPFLPPSNPTTSINNSGRVAFVAALLGGGTRLLTGDGGALTLIEAIPGAEGQVNPLHPGALNDAGTVAYFATHYFQDSGIFSGSGGPLTTIYSGLGVYGLPDINDAGTVAFTAQNLSTVTGNGGPLTQVPNGALYLSVDPSINNLGEVAFLGEDASNVVGIYLGDSLVPLVKRGDLLDGSAILGFQGGPSLNDQGQIAFSVYLADGRDGIWVANPVPEPASATLLAVGAALVLGWRSRRKRGRSLFHQ
jgi:hypothetical protein